MKKTKITLSAQTILQVDAGTYDAIRDGGDLYLLIQREDGVLADDETPEPRATKKLVQAPAQERSAPEPKASGKSHDVAGDGSENWSEEEMMEMSTDELSDECQVLGVNPDDTKGRNTNKKLRTLILDYHANGGDVADDTKGEEDEPAPRARGRKAPEPKKEELELIAEEDWETVKEGELVKVKLDIEGAEGEKIWVAEVVGWKKPKGSKEESLFVKFEEDGLEDYLREGDKLYEYEVDLD